MKKILLFVMAAGLAFTVNAQSQYGKTNERHLRVADGQEVAIQQTIPTPVLNVNSTKDDINLIPVCTATSQRGLRREEARVVSYNAELDVISVTSIVEPGVYTGIDDDGIICHFYSTDKGETWVGPVVINDDISAGVNYYYSGTLYNPAGNSDVTTAYGVSQGTINPSNGLWHYKAFGHSQLDGSNQGSSLIEETDDVLEDNGYWNIMGLTQVNDEVRCLNLVPTGTWGGYEAIALEPQVGEFTGTGFDWEFQDAIDMELTEDPSNGGAYWQGRWQGQDAATEIAWSADGMTGYMWVLGIAESDISGVQPVVYKTEDGGESWEYIYVDFQTDEAQAMIEDITIENWAGYRIPNFFESAGVVNKNGDLEVFACVNSHWTDIWEYFNDSIGYTYAYPGEVANFTINTDGLVNAIWIDSLLTDNVMAATEGNYCGDAGWQHRIQASRNADGSQVFCTWTDTRDPESEANIHPDLYGWTKAIDDNGDVSFVDPVCFTEGTLYETFYFFTNSALEAYNNGEGYTIPTVQGVTPAEFGANSSSAADPITVSYITGIGFPELTVGINDNLTAHNSISVSQNVPNPFNGTARITVSSETSADVMIEVTNIMGQTIYTSNEGRINGTKEITLNANNMEAGVYFYTVTVGNESTTKKMIVK